MKYCRVFLVFLLSFGVLFATETNAVPEGRYVPPMTRAPAQPFPNTFLVDGTNMTPFRESLWRRYNVVFFVAVPITFYLIMNVLMIKNSYIHHAGERHLNETDWNYIYLTTFLLPLFNAYHDQIFYRASSEFISGSTTTRPSELRLSIPLYRHEF